MDEVSQATLRLLIDAGTKSLLLAMLAGIVLGLLRTRNANFEHRVWAALLLGMLLLPLLEWMTPTVPLPISLTLQRGTETHRPPHESIVAGGQRARSADGFVDPFLTPSPSGTTQQPRNWAASQAAPADTLPEDTDRAILAAGEPTSSPPASPVPSADKATHSRWPSFLMAVYLAGLMLMSLRLAVGYWAMRRLRDRQQRSSVLYRVAHRFSPATGSGSL